MGAGSSGYVFRCTYHADGGAAVPRRVVKLQMLHDDGGDAFTWRGHNDRDLTSVPVGTFDREVSVHRALAAHFANHAHLRVLPVHGARVISSTQGRRLGVIVMDDLGNPPPGQWNHIVRATLDPAPAGWQQVLGTQNEGRRMAKAVEITRHLSWIIHVLQGEGILHSDLHQRNVSIRRTLEGGGARRDVVLDFGRTIGFQFAPLAALNLQTNLDAPQLWFAKFMDYMSAVSHLLHRYSPAMRRVASTLYNHFVAQVSRRIGSDPARARLHPRVSAHTTRLLQPLPVQDTSDAAPERYRVTLRALRGERLFAGNRSWRDLVGG
jgi:hypothetical protein